MNNSEQWLTDLKHKIRKKNNSYPNNQAIVYLILNSKVYKHITHHLKANKQVNELHSIWANVYPIVQVRMYQMARYKMYQIIKVKMKEKINRIRNAIWIKFN